MTVMAGPSQYQPPTAVRKEEDIEKGQIRNISTGLMRPLYTSCSEHQKCLDRNTQSVSKTAREVREAQPRFLTLNTLPRMPTPSPPRQQAAPMESPFLRLPTEIRLQIYSLLVLPRKGTDLLPSFEKVSSSTQDYFDYDKKQPSGQPATADLSHPMLQIRTVDPVRYKARFPEDRPHFRSGYSVRADRFRARCMATTYHCVNIPRIEHNLTLLRANKQIHAEVTELLYGSYTFDFDTHVEAIIPFLSDLTPFARSCIKHVRLVKRALPYTKEFDKCEWSNALRYLTSSHNNINLRRLELGIVAGRPGEHGWDRVARYKARDFELLQDQEDFSWLQYLLEIEGLQELDVQAVIEHCPPCTSSSGMANFVRFSASIETGFADFLKGQLLQPQRSRLVSCVA